MAEYYKHATKAGFLAFVDYINTSSFLPLRGVTSSTKLPAPDDKQQTTSYMLPGYEREFVAGGWGGPKIRDAVLDYAGVDQATRDSILASYSVTIVDIDPATDLVPLPDPEA